MRRTRLVASLLLIFAITALRPSTADATTRTQHYASAVTIGGTDVGGGQVAGTVMSSKTACLAGRTVTLFINDLESGHATTDAAGIWTIDASIQGGDDLLAQVAKRRISRPPHGKVCDADSSAPVSLPTNTAPILDASKTPLMASVNEDAPLPTGAVGTPVSNLVDSALILGGLDNVYDNDAGALLGVAVMDADASHGTWYYTTNSGTTWTPLGAVTATSARLLAASSSDRLYFRPNADFNGMALMQFRAWDRTSGTDGATGDSTAIGGSNAFSVATDNAAVVVNALNDAPVLDPNKVPTLIGQNVSAPAPSGFVGTPVPSIVDFAQPVGQNDNVTDIDSGALTGVAIIDADSSHGTWWYTIDNGTTWTPLGVVSGSAARLLAAGGGERIYFQPYAAFAGIATITFRAWDQSSGVSGSVADTSTTGGSTSFSTATENALITVT